jgi:hypothetical protein
MRKPPQYGHGLISIGVSYEWVPRSILRPNCRKLKNAGVLVEGLKLVSPEPEDVPSA